MSKLNYIKTFEALQNESKYNKDQWIPCGTWVSCDKKLPVNGQSVIVYRGNPNHPGDPKTIFVAKFKNIEEGVYKGHDNKTTYKWENLPSSYDGQEITYWMSLPEKPDRHFFNNVADVEGDSIED